MPGVTGTLRGTSKLTRPVLYIGSDMALLPDLVDAFTEGCLAMRQAKHAHIIAVVGAHFAT